MADALNVEPAITTTAAANAIAILRIMVSSTRYTPDTDPEPKLLVVDPHRGNPPSVVNQATETLFQGQQHYGTAIRARAIIPWNQIPSATTEEVC
jgi:hypothetical protein